MDTTRKNENPPAADAEPAGRDKPLTGKVTDPQFTHARASKAAAARHSLATYVRQVVDRAPDLTPEHAALLRSILPPVEGSDAPGQQ